MKRTWLMSSAAAAAMLLAFSTGPGWAQTRTEESTTVTARADGTVSVDTFRRELRNEGDFVRVDQLGEVWKPRDVDQNWRPYSNGRWIFNEKVGWYFESDEPWAEITYHYGRWYDDPDEGWVWVPGTEWAPAWVEWRRGKQTVGWRPLPPDNAPRRSHTRTTTTTTRTERGSGDVTEIEEEWTFVPTREITTERISEVRLPPRRVVEIYDESEPVGRVEHREGITVNFALKPEMVERDANIRIESQNLPRAQAAPVPAQVRSIATEDRTTIQGGARSGSATTRSQDTETTGTTSTEQSGTATTSRDRNAEDQTLIDQNRRDLKNGRPASGTAAAPADMQGREPGGKNASSGAGQRNGTQQNATDQTGKGSSDTARTVDEKAGAKSNAAQAASPAGKGESDQAKADRKREETTGTTASDEELRKRGKKQPSQAGRNTEEQRSKTDRQGSANERDTSPGAEPKRQGSMEQPNGGSQRSGKAEKLPPSGEQERSMSRGETRDRGGSDNSAAATTRERGGTARGSDESTGDTTGTVRSHRGGQSGDEMMGTRSHEGAMPSGKQGSPGQGHGKKLLPEGEQ